MKRIPERTIEAYLARRAKELGGIAYKFVSPGHAGVPDRLVCLPGGRVWFVELKAAGQKPRPLQQAELERLRALGFRADVIDSKAGVDRWVQAAQSESACGSRAGGDDV